MPASTPTASATLPSLSIVLPCFDEAENVAEAIRQADDAAGRFALDHEVIVVDDGSSDETRVRAEARRGDQPAREGRRARAQPWVRCRGPLGHRRVDLRLGAADRRRPPVRPRRDRADAAAHARLRGRGRLPDRPRRPGPAARRGPRLEHAHAPQLRGDRPRRRLRVQARARRRPAVARPGERRGDGLHRAATSAPRCAASQVAEVGVHHRPRVAGEPSGGDPRVVLRAFGERRALLRRLRDADAAEAPNGQLHGAPKFS